MKQIQKFFLFAMGVVLLATNAHAGRWITQDPMEVQEHMERDPHPFLDLNPYTFVLNNPVNYIDPDGLLTAVIIGGQASRPGETPNPFGHASIGFTGNGIYSFGTGSGKDFGTSFTDFLNKQATYRDSTVYILNTTPEQEQAMIDYLKKLIDKRLQKYPDNCANRVIKALDAAGIPLTRVSLASPIGMDLRETIPPFPSDIGVALRGYEHLAISIPKGTVLPPNFLSGFNPH
jgi:hypothetical protein